MMDGYVRSSSTRHCNLCSRIFLSSFQTPACVVLSCRELLGGGGVSVPVSSLVRPVAMPFLVLPIPSASRSRVNDRGGMALISCPGVFFVYARNAACSLALHEKKNSNQLMSTLHRSLAFLLSCSSPKRQIPGGLPQHLNYNTLALPSLEQQDTMSTCVAPPRPSFRLLRCKCYHPNPFSLPEVTECCHIPRPDLQGKPKSVRSQSGRGSLRIQ
ncbi:uncharacterized protein LY79DRAFT_238168 [Colletotrichum navitas]|uniref:Uncharacterized protein n=1 Tax=Colletotrichum navitas TaxID=681940 RepID=A0AAD8V4Y4_9PEZI|nr:uncharacterized protein LY79DRAFT_238168 [Colletotrichum navitas]KAK1589683.1 hypothetical protein LY79DRAFT_238168 [Colletotrichum navitas]